MDPAVEGWRESREGTGVQSPNSKLSRDRDALGSGASHVLLLARGKPVTPAQTHDRMSLHFLPVQPQGVQVGWRGGAWWEGSHHLKGVRKKPQGIRHVRTGEGCLQAGSTYTVGVPLPRPCERLLVFLECSES